MALLSAIFPGMGYCFFCLFVLSLLEDFFFFLLEREEGGKRNIDERQIDL